MALQLFKVFAGVLGGDLQGMQLGKLYRVGGDTKRAACLAQLCLAHCHGNSCLLECGIACAHRGCLLLAGFTFRLTSCFFTAQACLTLLVALSGLVATLSTCLALFGGLGKPIDNRDNVVR